MAKRHKTGSRPEVDSVRLRMQSLGAPTEVIATELSRRYGYRPRQAYRLAQGWNQTEAAQRYNQLIQARGPDHAGRDTMSPSRVSEYERWPDSTRKPSVYALATFAELYGTRISCLLDAADLEQLSPTERAAVLGPSTAPDPARPSTVVVIEAGTEPKRALERGNGDTGLIRGQRRLVRCDARGIPVREEIIMAADESAQFHRWSATTNVDDTILEQMTADLADLARREQIDPPALTYTRLLGARDDVFRLIAGHQQPHHTTSLYKIASQVTALLTMVTFDLGHPHAANTHARTALHCADMSGHTPIRVFIRSVQASIAYFAGRHDEAAELVDAAVPDATSGTTLLRLTSQQARINAVRNRPDEVVRALTLAETAPTERTSDEPGVLGFEPASAAMFASEAHHTLGGAENLDAALDWARTAVNEFTTEAEPRATYVAYARFNLAHTYLGKGKLEAVGEHLAPILHATGAEYRTVPVIGQARSLHTLLTQRTDLTSPTLTTLRDDLAGFITHPAPTPPQLETDPT